LVSPVSGGVPWQFTCVPRAVFGAPFTLALAVLAGAGCASKTQLADSGDGYGDPVSAREYGYVRPSSDAWMLGADQPPAKKSPRRQASGDLWGRVSAGMKLNRYANGRIDSKVNAFRQDPEFLAKLSARARPYLHVVVAEIERRGLPAELALLPHIESRYNPAATSPKAAAGMWQFIPSTGRIMGLRQDEWYDGRRDVLASTRAAMDYLQQLHRRLGGDWELAMAAYNCGPGRVESAQAANRSRGLPTDFWSLNLPAETESYVPQILAAARLVSEPAKYGMRLPPVPTSPQLEVVRTDRPVDLARVAAVSGVGLYQLKQLNPGLKRGQTAPGGATSLLVPVGTGGRVTASLDHAQVTPASTLTALARVSAMPVARERPRLPMGADRVHVVKSGESLRSIARAQGVDAADLAYYNAMQIGEPLLPGQSLRIPGAESGAGEPEMVTHRVQKGDSLGGIARRYGVNVSDLIRWNPNGLQALRNGGVIRIYRRGDESA
jgi:membrane-bound lytic murein transglycosylase D